MPKLLSTIAVGAALLVSGGSLQVFAQATPATPATPAVPGGPGTPATPAIPATPATPGARGDVEPTAAADFLATVAVQADEIAELDALATIEADAVTLVDVSTIVPGNGQGQNQQAVDEAIAGLDATSLRALITADATLSAALAAAGVSVDEVVAVSVEADGTVVLYYDSQD